MLRYITTFVLTILLVCTGLRAVALSPGEGPGSKRNSTQAARTVTNLGGAMQLSLAHTSIIDIEFGAAWMQTPLSDEQTIGEGLVLNNPAAFAQLPLRRQHAGPQLSLNLNARNNDQVVIQPQITAAYLPSVYARTQTTDGMLNDAFNTQLEVGEFTAAGRVGLGCVFRVRFTKRWAVEVLPKLQFNMLQGQRTGRLYMLRLALKPNWGRR